MNIFEQDNIKEIYDKINESHKIYKNRTFDNIHIKKSHNTITSSKVIWCDTISFVVEHYEFKCEISKIDSYIDNYSKLEKTTTYNLKNSDDYTNILNNILTINRIIKISDFLNNI